MGYRGSSSEDARAYRQRGHDDALEFALAIGLDSDYQNDIRAKKDVIDPSGDAHSVKSGQKKWQVFLYKIRRFESDYAWQAMNGIGQILCDCINAFPLSFDEYQSDKDSAKQNLKPYMRELSGKLQNPMRLRAFLEKSLFNGGEVDYLTVKQDDAFHVFWHADVVDALGENLEVVNSRAISEGQYDDQKVLFKYNGVNLGEIEMRNDSEGHYREIRFNMSKPKMVDFLFENIPEKDDFQERGRAQVFVYGYASKRFDRWR